MSKIATHVLGGGRVVGSGLVPEDEGGDDADRERGAHRAEIEVDAGAPGLVAEQEREHRERQRRRR
jgi:hypothetical protein